MKSMITVFSLILSLSSFADIVKEPLKDIVIHGCAAVAEEMFSGDVTSKCYATGERLIRQQNGPNATRVGKFITDLCTDLPTGGIFRPDYRGACLVGVARDSKDRVLKGIFNQCLDVMMGTNSLEEGNRCFVEEYRSL